MQTIVLMHTVFIRASHVEIVGINDSIIFDARLREFPQHEFVLVLIVVPVKVERSVIVMRQVGHARFE